MASATETSISCFSHDRFERLANDHYRELRAEVLTTVRGKLAVANLYPDPRDLDAAYNAAWHALYERSRRPSERITNLAGWLATITYRRAIDDIRSARAKHPMTTSGDHEAILGASYEPDLDRDITNRERYHQWLMSMRLRLNAREQQAVSLCVLHEHSRNDASDIMGVSIKHLDKIMVSANRKLGELREAISRGDWCEEQRSLIKAYALGLHEEGGERHALAARHLMRCPGCAAYVRSVRGLTVVLPAPTLLTGGIVTSVGGLLGGAGATAGGAAGGGTLLGVVATKTAAVCVSAACAAGGVVIVAESVQDLPRPEPTPRSAAASVSSSSPPIRPRTAAPASSPMSPPTASPTRAASTTPSRRSTSASAPSGAQADDEFGIESQRAPSKSVARPRPTTFVTAAAASDTGPSPRQTSTPKATTAARSAPTTEFGLEGP